MPHVAAEFYLDSIRCLHTSIAAKCAAKFFLHSFESRELLRTIRFPLDSCFLDARVGTVTNRPQLDARIFEPKSLNSVPNNTCWQQSAVQHLKRFLPATHCAVESTRSVSRDIREEMPEPRDQIRQVSE